MRALPNIDQDELGEWRSASSTRRDRLIRTVVSGAVAAVCTVGGIYFFHPFLGTAPLSLRVVAMLVAVVMLTFFIHHIWDKIDP